jgi:hypothetical protein
MISAHIVKLATDYLDQCAVENQQATLVGMLWHIDRLDRSIPLVDEVNEALTLRASVYVQQVNGAVVFTSRGAQRIITSEELRQAGNQYHKEFAAVLKKLEK